MPETLSVCIIARDEAERLPRCLRSVAFAQEVVLVDSGSRDGTRELAAARGAIVVQHAWRGFAAQRNIAIDNARCDWVLELDADEWLTPELAGEIRDFLRSDRAAEHDAGALPLRQHYLGRALRWSAHYPFYRPRLFRRGAYRHDEGRSVHEGLAPGSQPWVFEHELGHELAGSLREALADTRRYAQLEAGALARPSLVQLGVGAALRPAAKFGYQTFVLGGARDGWRGVLKVALECGADASIVARAVGARQDATTPRADVQTSAAPPHFGRRRTRSGPVRIAAVGLADARGEAWIDGAVAAGAWVTHLRREPGRSVGAHGTLHADAGGVRVHALGRVDPVSIMRALDAERQLGPFDATVALDGSARRALTLVPASVRSYSPRLSLRDDPVEFVRGASVGRVPGVGGGSRTQGPGSVAPRM